VKVCGISYDDGYQEYMVAPVEALARMPESIDATEAAPLLCVPALPRLTLCDLAARCRATS